MNNRMTIRWVTIPAALLILVGALTSSAKTWTGAGTSPYASEAANWSGGLPTRSDSLVLDRTTSKNMIWDAGSNGLPDSVAAWIQTADYTGTVTFLTLYGAVGFTHFTIAGNCVISNGTWTHLENTGGETNRLRVTAGSLTLGSNASINVQGKGFARGQGPGAGDGQSANGRPAASHGGLGADAINTTYGSITSPTHLGSGGYWAGGGAVWLTVKGPAIIDGTISAQAQQPTGLSGGSGGSILIEAVSLTGSTNGLIDASVPYHAWGSSQRGGGGGRIAVILTGSSSFGSVQMRAHGGQTQDGIFGAAGTIYLQTASQTAGTGTLLIDNAGIPSLAQTLMTPADSNLNAFSAILVTNQGVLGLNTNTRLNLGKPVNLVTYGPDQSIVATAQTNGLAIPTDWTLCGYRLRIYTNLAINGSLTVTNAGLETYAGWQNNVRVGGNLLVATNGTMTHGANGTTEQYRLALQVDGDLTVAAGGLIDVTGKGYATGQGPGRGHGSNNNGLPGASHGGRAAEHPEIFTTLSLFAPYWDTYGSVTTPTNLGSGGIGAGGGAAEIRVSGVTVLAGSILAGGYPSGGLAGTAGGSIFLTTGTLGGKGLIDASANPTTQYGGGGGRIAVILTNSHSFGGVAMRAFGAGTIRGAAGTIYRETVSQGAGRGVVTVNNDEAACTTNTITWIPASLNATAGEIDSLKYVTLMATNHAQVGLTTHLTLGDLYLTDDRVKLYLKGFNLTLKAERHDDGGTPQRVIDDGGQIDWNWPVDTFFKLN